MPFRKNCARCSPLSRLSGAGAGPSTRYGAPLRAQRLDELAGVALGAVLGPSLHDRVDERHGRRILHRLPEVQLLLEEAGVVLPAGVLDAVVLGEERLDDRLAANLAAAGAAGDLRQQLERSLPCPEIRQAEADVGRDHADERHARKVMALGDHLRADEDVELASGEPRQQRGDRAAPADRVAVDARDARAGKSLADLRLDALGAEADELDELAGAIGARPSATPIE